MEEQVDYAKLLNEKLIPIFKELETEIRKNQVSSLDSNEDLQPGDLYHIPTIVELNPSQKIDKTIDGSKLKEPMVGSIKDKIVRKENLDAYIQRFIIGYAFGARLVHMGQDEIRRKFLPIIHQALMSVERDVGFHYSTPYAGIYATFFRPGSNDIVRDAENYAGFELRVFSECISCVNFK